MFQWAELIPLTEYSLLTLFSLFPQVSNREELCAIFCSYVKFKENVLARLDEKHAVFVYMAGRMLQAYSENESYTEETESWRKTR